MTKRDLARVARATADAEIARATRDRLIREAHPRHTIRAIAETTGLSPARVHQILREEPKS